MKKLLLVACVVAASVGLVPRAAAAAAGGAITINAAGVVTGTAGDDLFVIGREGDFLTHNRSADPGFVSKFDFDSSTEGEQKRSVATGTGCCLALSLGDGDDTLKLVGAIPGVIGSNGADANLGAGNDLVDFSQLTLDAYFYAGPTVEKVVGSPLNDQIFGYVNAPGVSITMFGGDGNDRLVGTEGNDVLDGGAGNSMIEARAGADTITLSAPFNNGYNAVTTGDGEDTVIVRGTSGPDGLGVGVPRHARPGDALDYVEVYSFDEDPVTPKLTFQTEHLRFELLGDDDTLAYESVTTPVLVDGGDGVDEIYVDGESEVVAWGAGTGSDDRLVTAPHHAANSKASVRVTPSVETMYAINETMIATATGPGGAPHVRALRWNGSELASFYAYGTSFTGGVNVALGDLDGDGGDEIITGVGPGGGPHVRAFYDDGTDTGSSFYAYDDKFTGGVNVAAIDLDGDGFDEIVTAPASGGGPHIRIWSGDGELLDEWFAPGFELSGGLNIARGSVLGELGGEQIIVSAGAGQPSLVAVFEEDGSFAPQYKTLQPYAAGFLGGVAVTRAEIAVGDIDDGDQDEIVTAAGPGGGPHVQVFTPSPTYGNALLMQTSFFAFGENFRGGVNVATCNPDGGDDEILVGAGPGGAPHIRLVNKKGEAKGLSVFAYGENFHGGVRVACGGGGIRKL